ncbi:hypothetical protein [Bradyrhizobium sp.]|uniref:hypothetical protein n=1 Tax=Bradyrhizobium sp. TaxID=376 RepID=UPI0039E65011
MARQFGLKSVSSSTGASEATATNRPSAAAQCPMKDDVSPHARHASQPKPLYAPASWRGNVDRRSISLS